MAKAGKKCASLAVELPSHVRPGVRLLLQAHEYAEQLHRDPWDFAVEVSTLRSAGLTNNDFRWLFCQGYLEHAREITMADDEHRKFQSCHGLRFYKTTCFLLTASGRELGSESQNAQVEEQCQAQSAPCVSNGHHAGDSNVPQWDQDRHQFRLGEVVVKEFKLPALNQETVLTAFEEEGWPPSIDDPLPPSPGIDPKRRLHDTIKNLNRNQKQQIVRFMGDGTGQGIRWELVASNDHGNSGNSHSAVT